MDEHCAVCDRVIWGEVVRMGYGHWRHRECLAGSPEWLKKMTTLVTRTEEQERLYEFFRLKHPAVPSMIIAQFVDEAIEEGLS